MFYKIFWTTFSPEALTEIIFNKKGLDIQQTEMSGYGDFLLLSFYVEGKKVINTIKSVFALVLLK